jgi:hypothetical protein
MTTTKTLRKPTVHLNGTSPDALFEQLANVNGAIRKAISTLQEAAPHGRDYYPQGDNAINEATKEHLDRIARLRSVMSEIEELAEHVADARDARAARKAR